QLPLSKPKPKVSLLKAIWALIQPDLFLFSCIVLTAVAAAIVYLQTPVVTGQLINVLQSSFTTGNLTIQALNAPALRLLALLAAQGFFTFAHITLVTRFGEKVAIRLRSDLFAAIVHQDISFFDSHRSGELVGRLTSDVSDFKHTFKQVVTQGLKSITQTIGSAVQLFRISVPLTMTMLATMPLLYILLNVYGAYLRKLSQQGKILEGHASGMAGEVISNMRTVRAFAAEEREIDHYEQKCQGVAQSNENMGFHIGVFQGLTNVSIGCMVLTVLYYGGSLVVRNEMTCGELMTYMLSTQAAQQSLVSLGVLFSQTIKAAASASRVFEYIHLVPQTPLRNGAVLNTVKGNVQFNDVVFSYSTRNGQVVLDKFSLHIAHGTTVALCGASGSGKSTIASLLERFYEPSSGDIQLDGHELSSLDPSWLRQNIGFINQEPVLFATTIAENIRYGRPEATLEEVKEAARKANASSFIEGFSDGYNTMVGERGASLSGGQKQRIAIARAILKNPKVCLLLCC
ncbi:ABC transporter type 1, transmembrane domain-containing protein, partial [Spinellus fusiger]